MGYNQISMLPFIPSKIQLPNLRPELVLRPHLYQRLTAGLSGKLTLISASSGFGKTTLVNLVPRFYDVTQGAVRIDGLDVRDVTFQSLRSQISLVSQNPDLFNDTIYNNCRLSCSWGAKNELNVLR